LPACSALQSRLGGSDEGVQLVHAPLRHVRTLLTDDLAQTAVCSIIGSRLDYCSSSVEA